MWRNPYSEGRVVVLLALVAFAGVVFLAWALGWVGNEVSGRHDAESELNGGSTRVDGRITGDSGGEPIEIDMLFPLEVGPNGSAAYVQAGTPVGYVYVGPDRCAYELTIRDAVEPDIAADYEIRSRWGVVLDYGPAPSVLGRQLSSGTTDVARCGLTGQLTVRRTSERDTLSIQHGDVVSTAHRVAPHAISPQDDLTPDMAGGLAGAWSGAFEQFAPDDFFYGFDVFNYPVELVMTAHEDGSLTGTLSATSPYPAQVECTGTITRSYVENESGTVRVADVEFPPCTGLELLVGSGGNDGGVLALLLTEDAGQLHVSFFGEGVGRGVLTRTGS